MAVFALVTMAFLNIHLRHLMPSPRVNLEEAALLLLNFENLRPLDL